MLDRVPILREVVLIGGGHTHALFLRKWGMKPIPGVQISLISPTSETTYTGMLPGFLAGHYSREDISIDLLKLCRFSGARFIMSSVNSILSQQNKILVKNRGYLTYDIASIDIGVTSRPFQKVDFNSNSGSIKPLGEFVARWNSYKSSIISNFTKPKIVVIGGGVGAVEIALAMSFALSNLGIPDFSITVLDRSKVLSDVRLETRDFILSRMKDLGIKVLSNVKVLHCSKTHISIEDDTKIESNFTVVAAGATGYDWLKETDLTLKDGFIEVDRKLRVKGCSNVFAAGDCINFSFSPRPKAGVFAVRQAPILFKNIRSYLLGRRLRNFSPQKTHLKLISLGEKKAISDYFLPSISGSKVWKLKDHIDRSFMLKFSKFPIMPVKKNHKVYPKIMDKEFNNQMLCGGCGAKVGSSILNKVLQNLDKALPNDIIAGVGDDAAVISVKKSLQVLTTDHLREFNSDLWLFAKISAVHSLGDIWAMGAEPKTVMAHITVPEASNRIQQGWLNQIMCGALEVFEGEAAKIVGGHTSTGAEFSVGFSITGEVSKSPILISGAQPSNLLIITKPIGSGTILAGEMQLQARGRWVETALEWMIKPQSAAADILSNATAMTDITGFGLAGHLMRICEHSKVSANLQVSQIPFFPGSENLARQGIRSTIYEDNLLVKNKMSFIPGAKVSLIFDPQTSGGLLAAIPKENLDLVSHNLKKSGFCANVIGSISEGKPFISVT